ncbi:MAG: accessory factor UbiK family protein [Bauldia sp.]|uniref:accessory factor UbiK family protein n=1 Tax=Bauldia sp. TaxID=2575872 RepID=UPI001DD5137E|nr:accessory factor UbiK family protein [Bauldia sp.]MCB1496886.1 accessory factor UbiK family protein [Bauldia sp.]
MTQTSNRMFDELARLMTDAANVAQGVRREASTAFRSQAESWIAELDLVRRDEFDAVREMASRAREENEKLAARVAELEAQLKTAQVKAPKTAAKAASSRSASVKTASKPRRTTRKTPAKET